MKVVLRVVDGEIDIMECSAHVEVVQETVGGETRVLQPRIRRIFGWHDEAEIQNIADKLDVKLDKNDINRIIDGLQSWFQTGCSACRRAIENDVLAYKCEKDEGVFK